MSTCPDENLLARLLEGSLAPVEAAALDEHVDGCSACRGLLAALARGAGAPSLPRTEPDSNRETLPDRPGRGGAVLAPGTMVDHLRVRRLVGWGGMGEVYLARDTRLGRKVALKVLRANRLGSSDEVKRFLFEARTTARFSHPHIVTIHGVGEHEGNPYLALEFLDGQSLRQRLADGPLAPAEAIRIVRAVADALCEAHRHKILHRDLKPDNVLIPPDGRPRVVDFGLAHAVDDAAGAVAAEPEEAEEGDEFTSRGAGLRGTPAYLAPEQWTRQTCSEATDVWALGVMTYELLSGARPFAGRTPQELCAELQSPKSAPPLAVPGAQPGLVSLCARMLAKEPRGRPTAREVLEELDRITAEERRLPADESPFRGLLAFDERHAGAFFGREEEIATLLERLRNEPALPVVGPSGAGKSSFVQAGVIPRLRAQGPWIVLAMRPGYQPFQTLASRLVQAEARRDQEEVTPDPDRSRLLAERLSEEPGLLGLELQRLAAERRAQVLLFVDQLEELATLVADEGVRRRFMRAVCAAADDPCEPVRVIMTLREDFLAGLAREREARDALGHLMVVGSPGPDALRQILSEPVRAAGYAYDDPTLVDDMLSAVRAEPVCLPILQFAARQLWEARDPARRLLLRDAYEQSGGVAGALARHADRTLEGLTARQVGLARVLLLRLVTPERTRRVLDERTLGEGLGGEAAEVVERLVRARLLSARKPQGEGESTGRGEAELELAHESLIHSWGRLARWIEESREELAVLAEVNQAARLWQRRGRDEELWRGEALAEARRILGRGSTPLPEVVSRFLEAGARRERRRIQRLRLLGVALVVAVALVALVFAAKERQARHQQEVAERERSVAQREGARASLARGELTEARAKLRSALETEDSTAARALWRELAEQPLRWRRELPSSGNALAVSPDGRLLAVASTDTSLRILDLASGGDRAVLRHEDQVFAVAFAPGGRELASATFSGKLWLWTLDGGRRRELGTHASAVTTIAFDRHGRRLASAGWDRSIRVWDLAGGGPPVTLAVDVDRIYDLAFSDPGDRLACAGESPTVRIYRLSAGALATPEPLRLDGHRGAVHSVVFLAGERVASGGVDRRVRIWRMGASGGAVVERSIDARATVRKLAASGGRLAAACSDGAIRIFGLTPPAPERTLLGHLGDVNDLAFVPGGRLLVSAGWDQSVRLWDPGAESAAPSEGSWASAVLGIAFSPDGATLAAGRADGTTRLMETATGRELTRLGGHRQRVSAVGFSPDGRLLATASWDQTVRLWELERRVTIKTLAGHSANVLSLAFSPDGERLATGSSDKTVRLWRVRSGELETTLAGHGSLVWDVAFSPDGELLASSSADRSVRIWEVATQRLRRVLAGHEAGPVYGVAFRPDGEELASGGADRTIRLWPSPCFRTSDGPCVSRRAGPLAGRVYWLGYSPDGTSLGLPLSDGRALLRASGAARSHVLEGHRAEVNYLRFAPRGELLGTSSDDGTVRLWRAEGSPVWRTRALVGRPPRLLSHLGWRELARGEPARVPPATWVRAVEAARLARQQRDGVCLQRLDGAVERWSLTGDRRHFESRPLPGPAEVWPHHDGCLSLARGRLVHHGPAGDRVLGERIDAVSSGERILVARGAAVEELDRQGAAHRRFTARGGVALLAQLPAGVLVGHRDGSLELRSGAGQARPLQLLSTVAATRAAAGPGTTALVGFSDGQLGLWDTRDGALLARFAIHGPVSELMVEEGVALTASELGHGRRLDLRVFERSYCALLREVWASVPFVWEGGRAVPRSPRANHLCVGQVQ